MLHTRTLLSSNTPETLLSMLELDLLIGSTLGKPEPGSSFNSALFASNVYSMYSSSSHAQTFHFPGFLGYLFLLHGGGGLIWPLKGLCHNQPNLVSKERSWEVITALNNFKAIRHVCTKIWAKFTPPIQNKRCTFGEPAKQKFSSFLRAHESAEF